MWAGQKADGPYASVIPTFISQKKKDEKLTIYGDGEQTRDYIHVSDVVLANIAAMESPKIKMGEVINIATGNSVSVNQIASMITAKRNIEYVPERLEIKSSVADINMAKKLISWRPEVSLREGLKGLVDLTK